MKESGITMFRKNEILVSFLLLTAFLPLLVFTCYQGINQRTRNELKARFYAAIEKETVCFPDNDEVLVNYDALEEDLSPFLSKQGISFEISRITLSPRSVYPKYASALELVFSIPEGKKRENYCLTFDLKKGVNNEKPQSHQAL